MKEYTIKQAAKILEVSTSTIRRRIKRGKLKAKKKKKDSRKKYYVHIPTSELPNKKRPQQMRIDKWENLLIKGDNIEVLKKLIVNNKVEKKVSLIYIDPPFATNREFKNGKSRSSHVSITKGVTAYNDKLVGKEYLKFIKDRLILLKKILADNGSIYFHIDKNMGHYIKILMDEVFGKENFVNDITRIKCNPKNFKTKAYGKVTDMILFYRKNNDNYIWNNPRQPMPEEDIKRLYPKTEEDGRRYATAPIHAPGETENGATGQPWKGMNPPEGRHWRYSPDKLTELDEKGLIHWSSTGNPRKKRYADSARKKGKKRSDLWEYKDPQRPTYPTQKNRDMLKMIIKASSNPDDIVLDAFCGSGTTLLAANELNRKWIGIDESEEAYRVSKNNLDDENANYKSITNISEL